MINTALLIASPTLQDALIDDSTGLPLANGTVTLYQDNSRTTLKNWYYLSGSPGMYTYITLPNPLTLSSVGTICDANGNDTIPYFYPYSEIDNTTVQPYYIVVTNSNGQQQFTRQNFPQNLPSGESPASSGITLRNYISNNTFWRNLGSINATNVTQQVLSPSQHDGFSMPDMQFFKSTTGATDTITFNQFTLGSNVLPEQGITPEYYFNLNCSATGSETTKYVQFPICLHVQNLTGVDATAVIWAQNNMNQANGNISLSLLTYLGTGVTSPAPTAIGPSIIALNENWTQYAFQFTFPDLTGATLGNGGDDAFYLQINLPVALTCNINFTKPCIYLSSTIPSNDFDTYDQTDTIINSWRTGDVRTSINSFYPFGWVPMNNGTIGNASSNATARANKDTWPLFNLLWKSFNTYTNGSTNILAQMVTSSGSNVGYGGTAIADFNANHAITLTKSIGQVILGAVPMSSLLANWGGAFTGSNAGGNLLLTFGTNGFYNGAPVYFTVSGSGVLPTGLSANTIYYLVLVSPTTFNVATTFANAMSKTVISYTNSGTATTNAFSSLAGSYEGEYAHVQLTTELATHNHSATLIGGNNTAGNLYPTTESVINSTTSPAGTVTIGNTGSSTPFNVTQPGTYYNIYMKL